MWFCIGCPLNRFFLSFAMKSSNSYVQPEFLPVVWMTKFLPSFDPSTSPRRQERSRCALWNHPTLCSPEFLPVVGITSSCRPCDSLHVTSTVGEVWLFCGKTFPSALNQRSSRWPEMPNGVTSNYCETTPFLCCWQVDTFTCFRWP